MPLVDSRGQELAEDKVTLERGIAFIKQQQRPIRTGRDERKIELIDILQDAQKFRKDPSSPKSEHCEF
jgi:hypothetical protein